MSDSPAAMPHIGSNLGQSVVPDLMKVYESLTQSSTPHSAGTGASTATATAAAAAAGTPVDSTDHHANTGRRPGKQLPTSTSYEPQEQQQYAAYESPVPDLAQAPPPPPSLAAAATTAAPSASSKEKPSSSSSTAGRGVRSSTRKRGRDSQQSQGQATSASSPASSSGGRGSGGSRSRKKTTKADGRWSKRFQWPDELHREFVSAVFDVGLKHASPSALMEFMDVASAGSSNNHDASITSERVKSHLQKYRLHRARSKKEFLATYDAAMAKMRKRGSDGSKEDAAMGSQGYLVDREEIATLASGEVAAHLTCVASATDDAAIALPPTSTSAAPSSGGKPLAASMAEATSSSSSSSSANVLHLPQLTEEEKQSPIGASMGYLMGLFFALQQQLSHQRATKQARQEFYQQQQDQAAAAAPHSPLEAPATNPAGPEYRSYVAPPPQPPSHPGPSHSPHLETPQQQQQHQQQQHRYHQHASHQHHHHHRHHQPFGSHHDGQQAIETSTSAILEENNMMKRDMRAQMRFQNQMRAFKDKEVAKVQQQPPVHPRQHNHHSHTSSQHQDQHDAFAEAVKEQDSAFAAAAAAAAGEASSGEAGHQEDPTATAAVIAATAAASASGTARVRASSIGMSDADFWDSSLDDNELFDFLIGM